MGTPVPISESLVQNGTFTGSDFWYFYYGWYYADGQAYASWPGGQNQNTLGQNLTLIKYAWYKIEFDITRIFLGYQGQVLKVRINVPPAAASQGFTTTGHKTVYLQCLSDYSFIRFFVYTGSHGVPYVYIDNVTMINVAANLAVLNGFLPMTGTKSEVVDVSPTRQNVLLANWNGRSNVLIALDK